MCPQLSVDGDYKPQGQNCFIVSTLIYKVDKFHTNVFHVAKKRALCELRRSFLDTMASTCEPYIYKNSARMCWRSLFEDARLGLPADPPTCIILSMLCKRFRKCLLALISATFSETNVNQRPVFLQNCERSDRQVLACLQTLILEQLWPKVSHRHSLGHFDDGCSRILCVSWFSSKLTALGKMELHRVLLCCSADVINQVYRSLHYT